MEIFPSIWGISLDLWHAEHEGPEGLRRRQNGRFAALLAHARGASRFYRRLYQHLPADGVKLHDLPVVTKPELMEAFDDWVTDPRITRADVERFTEDPSLIAKPYRDDYFVCMSSGTTGIPGLFIYDPDAINMYRAIAFARIEHTWLGASDWLHMAQRGFRWAGVFGTGAHYVGAGWIELERQRDAFRAGAFRVFSVQQPLNELVADLNSFDPAMLTGYPSALELLADEQIAGRLALRFAGEMEARVQHIIAERERVSAGMARLPVDVFPSGANFVLFRPRGKAGKAVWQGLLEHSVLVRDCSSWPRLDDCLRITVGTPEENDEFLAALADVMAEVTG